MGLAKIFNESGVPHTVQIDREGALANDVAADWFASKQIHVVKTEVILVRAGKEIDQLIEQQIGVEVTPAEVKQVTEKGLRILQCKMVYKRKYHIGEDGKERFLKWKSRLAVVGSSEREGWETVYSTFSPTVAFSAIRLLISLTVDPKYSVESYDLSGAFLGTELRDRAVYIRLPRDAGMHAEAEYIALADMICEVKYLRELARGLGFAQAEPTLIYEDNRAAIMVAEAECSAGGRLKHVDVKYRFATEAVRNREVRVRYIPTNLNFADIMTKALVPKKHKESVELIVSAKDAYRIVTARREMADETYEASYFIIQLVGDSDGLY
jgi:hypothetical protein